MYNSTLVSWDGDISQLAFNAPLPLYDLAECLAGRDTRPAQTHADGRRFRQQASKE